MNSLTVSTFAAMLMNFSDCFTAPTFANFRVLMEGWLLCEGRRTVTRVLLAGRGLRRRSFGSYHRFFSRARWSLDALGRVVFQLALAFVPDGEALVVAVDDTLTRKTGKRIWGAGMHHDPLRSTGRRDAFSFGHNWVVLSLQVPLPWLSERRLAIPILLRLYRRRVKKGRPPKEQKATGAARAHEYRTRPELAVELLDVLAAWAPDRVIHVLGDTAYGGKSVSQHLPVNVHLTSRMTMKAALYGQPEPQHGRGRPRKKGERLPSPAELAASRKVPWRQTSVAIYGKQVPVLYKAITALWYNSAGTRLLNIVVVRDPSGRRKDDCFFTTDLTTTPEAILQRLAMRWPLELTFHDAKQFLGLEDPQNRVEAATTRTAPMALYGYGLVVLWFAKHGRFDLDEYLEAHPWYRQKKFPSFADMLDDLRAQSLAEQNIRDPGHRRQGAEIVQRPVPGMSQDMRVAA